MRTSFVITVFGILAATSPIALSASSVTYTYSAAYGPGSPVTYIETVVSQPASPPVVKENSTPCTTLPLTGCPIGSFSDAFSRISVPTGDYVQSASLDLHYAYHISQTAFNTISVSPIDTSLPFFASTSGAHYTNVYFIINTAAGSYREPDAPLSARLDRTGIDYTTEVQSALAVGAVLSPITVDEMLSFGYQTAQSASSGKNSTTVFNSTFDLTSGNLDAVLTVNFAPVPEPSSFRMFTLSLFGIATCVCAKPARVQIQR